MAQILASTTVVSCGLVEITSFQFSQLSILLISHARFQLEADAFQVMFVRRSWLGDESMHSFAHKNEENDLLVECVVR